MTRLALVTGGGIRVGRGIALALGRAGFDVAVAYGRSAAQADAVVTELRALGRRAEAFACDLAQDPESLVPRVRAAMGPLDVLVNNAATFERDTVGTLTREGLARQMMVNAFAPALLVQAAAEDLAREGRGRVINIADLSAWQPFPGQLGHSLSKAALVNLTLALARELAPRIQVHAVVPGPVAMPPDWGPAEVAAELALTPAGRVGSPDDVGEAVVHLATCSPFTTGVVMHVSGGRHLT